jgi:hypothetical protein
MPGDPVLYDDGGSTRIKKVLRSGAGDMDALFNVRAFTVNGEDRLGADETVKAAGSSFGTIRISIVDSDGAGFSVVPPTAFREFEIQSGDQRIKGTLERNSTTGLDDFVMLVHGPKLNPPIVESRQSNGQRRYIVSNAPPIDGVTITPASGGQPIIYRANATGVGSGSAVYTSVRIV